jgi:hypothetical protein
MPEGKENPVLDYGNDVVDKPIYDVVQKPADAALGFQAGAIPKIEVRVEGDAYAKFDEGGSYKKNIEIKREPLPATQCTCREGVNCINLTGKLLATFKVTEITKVPPRTFIKLPPNIRLKPCQQRLVDQLVSTIDAHEAEHVKRFNTYNGTNVEIPYNFTKVCENELEGKLKAKFEEENRKRLAKARDTQGLDPFVKDLDLNC